MRRQTALPNPEAAVGSRDAAGASPVPGCTVVVSADHPLVADSVRTALASRGLPVRQVAWPAPPGPARVVAIRRDRPHVGIAIAELGSEQKVVDLGRLVRGVRARWLLLTETLPGPVWGAALEQGVVAVCPSSMTLDDLVAAIRVTAAGGRVLEERRARELRMAWRQMLREQETLRARVQALSPRESRVLALLYAGDTVRVIAVRLNVSQATVRTHVRSILRKLDVRSQLEAVALYAAFQAGVGETGSPISG